MRACISIWGSVRTFGLCTKMSHFFMTHTIFPLSSLTKRRCLLLLLSKRESPTENVSVKSCAQQRWSIYVQSSLVKRGYFTWRADDHEKLNRKQKLYRFKQVKWLKKSGKNIANFWLLTFFSFLQVSESFCEFRFLLFFFKSKVLTFLCFSRKAKKSANFWW